MLGPKAMPGEGRNFVALYSGSFGSGSRWELLHPVPELALALARHPSRLGTQWGS
jgi:hypothetical protein